MCFQREKMASCHFCKVVPEAQLKNCVCKKVSYCSKECQAKDWKAHKSSCPPFVVRESPGKGRGLFATKTIKPGQIILDEYPLLVLENGMDFVTFGGIYYPQLDQVTKSKILRLHDPAENFKTLDSRIVDEMIRKNPNREMWKEEHNDEVIRIMRIFGLNALELCNDPSLNISQGGLYNNISLINHACIPNATPTWVNGDLRRKQIRALMIIEKDEEILVSFRNTDEFNYGSRESRRQYLLEASAFLCQCSECSLEGEALRENEKTRADIRKKIIEIEKLRVGFAPRRSVKKSMKLAQDRLNLIKKLNLREIFVVEMLHFYSAARQAQRYEITAPDPNVFKQEALKYAKMFGDTSLSVYNNFLNMYEHMM